MIQLSVFRFIAEIDHVQRPVVTLEEIVLDTRDDTKELDEFLNN